MNRVTIKELYGEIDYDEDDYIAIKDIEIVPRKMVEMIIEKIKGNMSICVPDSYAMYTLDNVLQYAESLLKRFEENKE